MIARQGHSAPSAYDATLAASTLANNVGSGPASGPSLPVEPVTAQSGVRDTGVAIDVGRDSAFAGRSMTTAPMSTSARSTVLPRVEHQNGEAKLVVDGRLRYEPQKMLGVGGIGEVIGAFDNDIGRPVALKRLKPEVRVPGMVVRFVDEIRTVGRLEHPNIVPIHDVGMDEGGDYYFVMKYVEGETLESILQKLDAGDPVYHARYGFERRVQIFLEILHAVAYAHDKGIVHRDIKPANVMVGPYGEVVLMDWGIAKAIKDPVERAVPKQAEGADDAHEKAAQSVRKRAFKTMVGSLLGTPAYMSPEQSRGQPVDERSDIYSLSVMFHEMLTLRHYLMGKPTLDALLEGVRTDPLPFGTANAHPHQALAPMELFWFVRKGTEKDAAARFSSVREMIDTLGRRADGDIEVHCPATFTKHQAHRWLKFFDAHPYLVMTMLFVLTMGFLGGMGFTIFKLIA